MSLAGAYGKSVHELAKYFIRHEYYELAGTDLHSLHQLDHLHNSSITHSLKDLVESGKLLNPGL
jgi:tyrosine-protein phosphatase YwqE